MQSNLAFITSSDMRGRYLCPLCGRPFIDQAMAAPHIRQCREDAQRRLDDEWKRKLFEKAKQSA